MKKLFAILTIAFTLTVFVNTTASAQCDTISTICGEHITSDFISDGQSYIALLNDEEVAEFHTTFFGGSTYRIAACSGFDDGNLIFSVFDKERNLLFTSSEYGNAPYWDFEVNSTIDCIIEANLNTDKVGSGCAVLLIGFQE